ncbi:MAG: CsiV family protein [Acidiferrobacterales bacterium]
MRLTQISALAALVLTGTVEAASPTTSPELYELEILIFQTNLSYLEGEELWTQDVVDTKLPGIAKAVNVGNIPTPDSKLSKAAITLEADGNYRVLVHRRWQQEAKPRSEADWVHIRTLTTGQPELEGTLRFYQGRYLHVNIELLFRESNLRSLALVSAEDSVPRVYRISEHRRIRGRDVNYVDHPKFGALVQVTPVEEKESE